MAASPQPAPSRAVSRPFSFRPHPHSEVAAPPAALALSRCLAAWHLLSLDAPTIATLWTVFIARCAGITLPLREAAAMFLAVWILYAADRLLDTRGNTDTALEARHRFHRRHRALFRGGLLLACPVLTFLLRRANPTELRLNILLGILLLAWLLVIHFRSVLWTHPPRLPKELAVGLFFAAAISIPTVARMPSLRLALLPDALLFAAVCSLNCLYIFHWEHPANTRHHAHASTRWAVVRLPVLAVTTSSLALAVATFFVTFQREHNNLIALPTFACAGSAALLLLLDRNRERLSPLTLRAAADLCLLTPVLIFPALRLLT